MLWGPMSAVIGTPRDLCSTVAIDERHDAVDAAAKHIVDHPDSRGLNGARHVVETTCRPLGTVLK